MVKLLGLEILLATLTGVFTMYGVPLLLGRPPAWPLFVVGLLMTLSFIALYAIALMGGGRMSARARLWAGLLSWVAVFWQPLLLVVGAAVQGRGLPPIATYVQLAPLVASLVPVLAALVLAPAGRRPEQALWAFYSYSFPMLGIRYLLVPMVQINPVAVIMAMHGGAFYLLVRGLIRIVAPSAAEGNEAAGPLLHRPVPDRIVGLVEGTTHRNARPFATRADGSLDDQAISITCRPEDVASIVQRLNTALADQPFVASPGETVGEQAEVAVRLRQPIA